MVEFPVVWLLLCLTFIILATCYKVTASKLEKSNASLQAELSHVAFRLETALQDKFHITRKHDRLVLINDRLQGVIDRQKLQIDRIEQIKKGT